MEALRIDLMLDHILQIEIIDVKLSKFALHTWLQEQKVNTFICEQLVIVVDEVHHLQNFQWLFQRNYLVLCWLIFFTFTKFDSLRKYLKLFLNELLHYEI